jgi:RimJ/RimL family protein N-acetyltransferase
MRRVAVFSETDLLELELVPQQAQDFPGDSVRHAVRTLAAHGSTFTLRASDGRLLCICGLASTDAGCAYGWAFMSRAAARQMRFVTRTVRKYLDDVMPRYRRIEIVVRQEFSQAVDWAAMLGFEQEGIARAMAKDGGDMLRFARINRDWTAEPVKVAA